MFLWRGFQHDWLRTFAGFRTPHRISKLHSFISHDGNGARFEFGQATGVDGNYMRPVGYYGGFRAPGVRSISRSLKLAWTDEVDDGAYPQARSDRSGVFELDLADVFGDAPIEQCAVVLGGFRLDSVCDPAKQPADNPRNSDGMWPFKLGVWLGEVEREGTRLRCPVSVQVHRAWTPLLGGLPPFEIKPLNARLDLEVEVRLTVIVGTTRALRATRGCKLAATAPARDARGIAVHTEVAGARSDYPHAISALHGFGFELLRKGKWAQMGHLGRYLNNLRFRLEDGDYDPGRGVLDVAHHAQVWIPTTVLPSDVRCWLGSTLLQLGPGARVVTNRHAHGQLCFNSTEQAPFFSRWCECGKPGRGPEQSQAQSRISLMR